MDGAKTDSRGVYSINYKPRATIISDFPALISALSRTRRFVSQQNLLKGGPSSGCAAEAAVTRIQDILQKPLEC